MVSYGGRKAGPGVHVQPGFTPKERGGETILKSKFKPNQGGHAPGHLRDAFVRFVGDKDGPAQGAIVRQVAGKLWNCTDIMPEHVCEALDMEGGSTYAMGARKILKDT